MQFQIDKNFCDKKLIDKEVNAQIDKDLNPSAERQNFHREIIYD